MRRSVLVPALLSLAVGLAGKPAAAAPITIVDTGPGTGELASPILGGVEVELPLLDQWLATEFTVSDSWLIVGVEGWIDPGESGSVRFRLYSDGGDLPGSRLFEQALFIAGTGPTGWYGPSGLNWPISPGSYWLAFEPTDTFFGEMPRPSENPLDHGAFQFIPFDYAADDDIDIGVRVFAEAQAVPEALPTVLVIGSGLLAAGIHAGRRRRLPVR